jgi:hypothetical protein
MFILKIKVLVSYQKIFKTVTFLFSPLLAEERNVNNTTFLNIAVPFEKRLIFMTFSSRRLGESTRINLLLRAVLNRNSYNLVVGQIY